MDEGDIDFVGSGSSDLDATTTEDDKDVPAVSNAEVSNNINS
jgi:hypothetical protein